MLINTNIRARKLEELSQDLSESEAKYRAIFKNEIYAVCIFNLETFMYLDVNEAHCAMYGYSRKEFLSGITIYDISNEPLSSVSSISQAENQADIFIPLRYHKKKDGTIFPVEIVGGSFVWKNRNVMFIIAQDITERIRAEKALQESEAKHSSMIANISDVVCITDTDDILKYISPNIAKWFGWQPQDLTRTKSMLMVHPDDLGYVQKGFSSFLKKDHSVKMLECRLRCKDGSYKPIHLTSVNLMNDPVINGVLTNYHDISERKQAEDALRESEQNYRTLADSGHTLVWASGTDKLYNYFNRVWLEFTGRTPEQEMGNGWTEGVHPEDLQYCLDVYTGASDRQEKFSMDYRLKRYDDEYRWLQDDGCPRYNSSGEFTGYIGHCIDITEHKQAMETLRLRESYLSAIIENQSGLFWLKDPDGRVLVVNKNFSDEFGFDNPESLVGKTDYDLWLRELADKYIAEDRRVIETKKTIIVEESILDEGNLKWFETYKAPIFDHQGKVIGTTGYSINITGRKQAEDALQKSIQRLEFAMNTADMAWWEIELPSGNIAFGKRKAEMLGFPPERFKHSKDFMTLVHPDDYEPMMDAMRRHLDGILNKYETEYRILTASNEYKWFYDIGTIVETDSNKTPVKVAGLVLDITERKAAQLELMKLNEKLQISKIHIEDNLIQEHLLVKELIATKEKLEEINSEKDRLFSIIAHNLKSPFQGFLGLTESMAENIDSFSQAELSEAGREMHIASKNIYTLLNNLFEWAHMRQGMISSNPTELFLSDIVSENINLIIKHGKQKGIEITCEIDPDRIVYADEAMLNSILHNLLVNAVKFTEHGGKVNVKAKITENNMMEISVTDTGIGMSEKFSDKLFKIDEKVGRKGTDGESGTGLGLLLCKEFVERHGGRIRVESEQGKGSTFFFTIPVADKNSPFDMD
ncbi:MAG: PAS domain S-box protein [Ignavibacteria bacterium]